MGPWPRVVGAVGLGQGGRHEGSGQLHRRDCRRLGLAGATVTDEAARLALRGALDQTFFVEAAAGTGKTHELVQRAVALIAGGACEVDRLAVVSFTAKAAGDLSLRIRASLDQARATATDREKARLEDAIARLEEATIDTIHGFAGSLLRARPIEAGLDPSFTVSGSGRTLLGRVLRAWFAERLADPSPALERFLARSRRSSMDAPSAVLEDAAWAVLNYRELDAPWPRPDVDLAAAADEAEKALLDAASLLSKGDESDELRRSYAEIEGLAVGLPGATPAEREAVLAEARRISIRAKRKPKGHGPYAPGVPRGDVRRAVDGMLRSLDRFETPAQQDLAALMREELRAPVERYLELSKAAGQLDFGGVLLAARDLLRDEPEARRALQSRFQRILVDEFQDTDPLQVEILLFLASEDPEEKDPWRCRPAPGRLMLVGDPKQSIYGFRRADLEQYRAVRDLMSSSGAKVVTLSRSHRSVRPLQDFVNHAFSPRFVPDAGQPAYVPLEGGPMPIEGQPAVVALPVYGSPKEFQAAAARVVANFVHWLVQAKAWSVRGEEGLRRVETSDVCLLFKQAQSWSVPTTAKFQDALEDRGLDNVLVGSRALSGREEVEALHTALSAIERPEDELSVYGTLRGPLFSLPDETLWLVGQARGTLNPFSKRPTDDAALDDALATLRDLSRRRNRRPFAETVTDLLKKTRAHVALGLWRGGPRVLAHVERVLELARAHESEEGLSFRGFVDRLGDELEKPRSTDGPVNEESAPGVRLMTAHKSKGLEFPVVVLADPHTKSFGAAKREIRPKSGLAAFSIAGLSPLLNDDGPGHDLESLRLAYVAATRARDLLVIPCLVGDDGKIVREGWLEPLLRWMEPEGAAMPCPGLPDSGRRWGPAPFGLFSTKVPGVEVAWWDPNYRAPGIRLGRGIAFESFLERGPRSHEFVDIHSDWQARLEKVRGDGSHATRLRQDLAVRPRKKGPPISDRTVAGAPVGPGGRRYGTLVHRAARELNFGADGGQGEIEALVVLHARALDAPEAERKAAVSALTALLADPLVQRARAAPRVLRDHPVVAIAEDGSVVDVRIDLLFDDGHGLVAVDLITGSADPNAVRGKMAHALAALAAAKERVAAGVLLRLDAQKSRNRSPLATG